MRREGWKQLIDGWPWFRGEGNFHLLPNSEFMPPIRLVRRPYGTWDTIPVSEDDPWGWPITEYEEAITLRPGLQDLACHILAQLVPLCRGEAEHGIPEYKLRDNPYWPPDLAKRAHALEHERFVLLLPLALSQTQDDKANIRWTLFGNSEQGPARAFWKSFYTAPGKEAPAQQAVDFFRSLLAKVYGESKERLADLRASGFRILSQECGPDWLPGKEVLPSWTVPFMLGDADPLSGVKYLLTFRPFRDLPLAVRRKYCTGELHLLPFPGSLLFWGVGAYHDLNRHLRLASQLPLLQIFERHYWPGKLRVPQTGWFEEGAATGQRKKLGKIHIRPTYKRSYRNARVHRYEDCLVDAHEHHITHVMFSTRPDDIDLYHKPMARNVQLWTHDFKPLLDGPRATQEEIYQAALKVAKGGLFGYRFLFPPMSVGRHQLYWHRPLVAYLDGRTHKAKVIDDAPLGYLTAYPHANLPQDRVKEPTFDNPVELWPRMLKRDIHLANVDCFRRLEETPPRTTMTNVYKLLDAFERTGHKPLPRSFARHLLTTEKGKTLAAWLRGLPGTAKQADRTEARKVARHLESCLAPEDPVRSKKRIPTSLTFDFTANRVFEEEYWHKIAYLSSGAYANKNNADCILDKPTQSVSQHSSRDLENVGNHLLDYYARLITERGMKDSVRFGELPFRWQTQYPFPWMGGWLHNQEGLAYERNLLVMIPGKDRSRAVLMADHYDTAYMYDCYERSCGGNGARLSAPGADDNCSATVALMLGARAFLELSRQGKLACDVWLLHLTGEEYPAEGQGAIRMCQWLVEGNLALKTLSGKKQDLSRVRIQGIYVLDMIAHNNPKGRDIFQIAPGASPESLWLAQQAHQANMAWNLATEEWNRAPARGKARRTRRCTDNETLPALGKFLPLHGEIRPHFDPRSTLFNTDGQAFSDVGIPVVLFMENYDIDRQGYHDTHDNMTNIDLDYGAALAAITIESVARAATAEVP